MQPTTRVHLNKTLFDMIRDEPNTNKKGWKTFRDKLRLRRAGAAWTSSVHIPASDVPIKNSRSQLARGLSTRAPMADDMATVSEEDPSATESPNVQNSRPPMFSRASSTRVTFAEPNQALRSVPSVRLSAALAAEREEQLRGQEASITTEAAVEEGGASTEEAAAAPPPQAEPVRMSLMDLLEDSEGWSSYMGDEDEEEEEEEEEEETAGEVEGTVEYNCCVCMVRHKGAAFIPCGHTFCRLCSRELYVSRGNCPLCNNFILEILDIF